mmetsp:Transcript_84138/g.238696  ORF Transcript_84138/g.238696 Transcript_84138/m.238696 type:complete len:1304 (-) Transcript_84138:58-3969(-)
MLANKMETRWLFASPIPELPTTPHWTCPCELCASSSVKAADVANRQFFRTPARASQRMEKRSSLDLPRQVLREVERQHCGRLQRLVLPDAHEGLAADEEAVLQRDHDRLAVGLLHVAGEGADVVRVEGGVHLVQHHEGRLLVRVYGEQERHGRQRLLAAGEQVHVAEALRRGHGGELDAAVEGLLGVLQVQVRRASVRVEARRVGGEAAVDLPYLARDLLEAVEELFLPGAAHGLELRLDVLDVLPSDVRLARRGLDVLGDALHLVDGLQVRAQPLEFHPEAVELGAVLVLEHLRRRARRCGLLLLRQEGEVHGDVRGALHGGGRPLLGRSARGLARRLREVLEGLEPAAEHRHLDVLQHALPQGVHARVEQGLLRRPEVPEALLHGHELLPLRLGHLAEARQALLLLALALQALLDFALVLLPLRLEGVPAPGAGGLLLAQLVDLRLELREGVLGRARDPLLQGRREHHQLGLYVAQSPRELVVASLACLPLFLPLPLELPHVVHAHCGAEPCEVAAHRLAEALFNAALLLAQPPLLEAEARGLGVEALDGCFDAAEVFHLLLQLLLAPVQLGLRLVGLALQAPDLVLEGGQVGGAARLGRVDHVQPAVDRLDPLLGRVELGQVELGRALARGVRVHGEVAVLGDGLARERHELAAEAQILQVSEGELPRVRHRVRDDRVTEEELERLRVLLVEGDAGQGEPQGAVVVHDSLEPRVRLGRPQVVQGQERHRREHALLEVAHALAGGRAGVDDDGVQVPADRDVHRDMQPLLRGDAEVDHPAVHARDGAHEALGDLRELALALQLALGRCAILDRVQQLLPLVVQLLLLLLAGDGGAPQPRKLGAPLLGPGGLPLVRRAHRLLGLLQLGDALLEVAAPPGRLAEVPLGLRLLRRGGADLLLELAHAVAPRGGDAGCLLLQAVELLALLRREVELPLRDALADRALLGLELRLLLLQRLNLPLDLAVLLLVLLGVLVEVLHAALQEGEPAAGGDALRVQAVELRAGGHRRALGLRRREVRLRALPLRRLDLLAPRLELRLEAAALALRLAPRAARVLQLPGDPVEPEHEELAVEVALLGLEAPVLVRLVLLVLDALPLVDGVPLLGEEEPGVVLLLRLLGREPLVLLPVGLRAGDLLEEGREVLALPPGRGLHVPLEHEEVPDLGQNVDALEPLVVVGLGHGLAVDLEARLARAEDGAPEDQRLRGVLHLVALPAHVGEFHESGALVFLGVLALRPVDEVAEPLAAQLARLDAEDEAHGVHEVGLSCTVRADDACEFSERADVHAALVGLEILDDDLVDPAHTS